MIRDEVATGFGRTGALLASEQCGLRPDLRYLGKGITGGYLAMSATVASGEMYGAFLGADLGPATFSHGHSGFAANLGVLTVCGGPIMPASSMGAGSPAPRSPYTGTGTWTISRSCSLLGRDRWTPPHRRSS